MRVDFREVSDELYEDLLRPRVSGWDRLLRWLGFHRRYDCRAAALILRAYGWIDQDPRTHGSEKHCILSALAKVQGVEVAAEGVYRVRVPAKLARICQDRAYAAVTACEGFHSLRPASWVWKFNDMVCKDENEAVSVLMEAAS